MKITTVLFDLDGVLASSWTHIIACYSHTVERLGLPKDPLRDPKMRHLTYHQTFKHLGITSENYEKADRICTDFANENLHLIEVFPSAISTLNKLHRLRIRIGVVTNRYGNASAVLKHCGLFEYVELIVSAEDVPVAKPHPFGMAIALDHFDVEPEKAVMVGDTCSDIYAGNAAGLITVALETSNTTEARAWFEKARPHHIITDLKELIPLILHA